jgi:hypothetical protein
MSNTEETHWAIRRIVIPMGASATTLAIVHLLPHTEQLPHGVPDILAHPLGELIAELVVSSAFLILATWGLRWLLVAISIIGATAASLWLTGAEWPLISFYGLLSGVVGGFTFKIGASLKQLMDADRNPTDYDESIGPDPGAPAGLGCIIVGVFLVILWIVSFTFTLLVALYGFHATLPQSVLAAVLIVGASFTFILTSISSREDE